jgi:hypothetical protein
LREPERVLPTLPTPYSATLSSRWPRTRTLPAWQYWKVVDAIVARLDPENTLGRSRLA